MSLRREPDEAISYGMYRAMVEQRNEARAEVERLREALQRLWADGSVRAAVGEGCALYTEISDLLISEEKGA